MSHLDDRAIEAQVDAAIAAGARLPRWGWGIPGPYNGATGEERIFGWQKVQIALRMKLIGWPRVCSVCEQRPPAHHHAEVYFRPLTSKPVCRPCHFRIHQRFGREKEWLEYLHSCTRGRTWASTISLRELSREEALFFAQEVEPLNATKINEVKVI